MTTTIYTRDNAVIMNPVTVLGQLDTGNALDALETASRNVRDEINTAVHAVGNALNVRNLTDKKLYELGRDLFKRQMTHRITVEEEAAQRLVERERSRRRHGGKKTAPAPAPKAAPVPAPTSEMLSSDDFSAGADDATTWSDLLDCMNDEGGFTPEYLAGMAFQMGRTNGNEAVQRQAFRLFSGKPNSLKKAVELAAKG